MLWSWIRKTANNRLAAAWTAAAVLTAIGIIPLAAAVAVVMAERAAAATAASREPIFLCSSAEARIDHPAPAPAPLHDIKIEHPQSVKENAGNTPCAVFF